MTFTVTVQPSGRQFNAMDQETLLAAGIRQGIGLPYGCKDGACGSCKCRKLSGTVALGPHQTKALSPEEEAQGYVLTCCGTATSDVVLESRQVTHAEGDHADPLSHARKSASLAATRASPVIIRPHSRSAAL